MVRGHVILLLSLLLILGCAFAQAGENDVNKDIAPPGPGGLEFVPEEEARITAGQMAPVQAAPHDEVDPEVAAPPEKPKDPLHDAPPSQPGNGPEIAAAGAEDPVTAADTHGEDQSKNSERPEPGPPNSDPKPAADDHADNHGTETPDKPPSEEPPPNVQMSTDHNPWRIPVPGRVPEELQADHSFEFAWYPNTEGPVNLELWKIENNLPTPKYMLVSNMVNNGSWIWHIHRSFPHGTGYCMVIVPVADRQLSSLSPLFTIIGPEGGDYNLPTSEAGHNGPAKNWRALKVNHEGASDHFIWAVVFGFLICNVFAIWGWTAWGGSHSGAYVENWRGGGLGRDELIRQPQKTSGKRKVFHARTPTRGNAGQWPMRQSSIPLLQPHDPTSW